MAKTIIKYGSFFAILFIFILLAGSDHMKMAEARICERRSKTWTGFCGETSNCNEQCIKREDARSGSCHFDFPGFACFCYFNC